MEGTVTPMAELKDLTGRRFGRLVVSCQAGRDKQGRAIWGCLCDCGNQARVKSTNLIQGHTNSCGCLHREQNVTHGRTNSRLYYVWTNMKNRCNNPENRAYPHYGGRGITVCDEWYEFDRFMLWAESHGYAPGLTLDRIDVNGNYKPDNCRWADVVTQQNNKRNNYFIEFGGHRKTLSEWARETGIGSCTLRTRLEILCWPVSRALTEPVRGRTK